MGIELVANSLSPVESIGLTLLEDLIWAEKRGFCAQVAPKFTHRPKRWTMGAKAQKVAMTRGRLGAIRPFEASSEISAKPMRT